MGMSCAISFVTIFVCHDGIAGRNGGQHPTQPGAGGFEIEDVLYLIGPIAWLGGLPWFLTIAAVGAPLYAAFVFGKLLRLRSPN